MLEKNSLSGFTGTSGYYKWSMLFPRMCLSDGAKYVADHGGGQGAYWLMDAIASHQPKVLKKDPRLAQFQIWELKVKNGKAVLTCIPDSGEKAVVTQRIPYTDFDLSEIRFYVMQLDEITRVIFLPSEY